MVGDPARSRGLETPRSLCFFSTQAILSFCDTSLWFSPRYGIFSPRSHFSPPGVGPSRRQKDNLSPKGMIWYPQLPPSLQKLRRFLPQSTHVSSRQRSEVRPPQEDTFSSKYYDSSDSTTVSPTQPKISPRKYQTLSPQHHFSPRSRTFPPRKYHLSRQTRTPKYQLSRKNKTFSPPNDTSSLGN